MAGPRANRSSCWNLLPAVEDELAGVAPIESSGTPTPTPVVFRVLTPALATAPVVASSSDNELFKQFIKA